MTSTRPTASNRPYQGYPYVNPMVIDAPSIDSATASRWANLPRRPIAPVRRPDEVADESAGEGPSGVPGSNNREEQPRGPIPVKKEPDDSPVVYIDLPEEGGSDVAQNREDSQRDEPSYVQETILYDPFENRRIDVGESTRSDESQKSESSSSMDSGDSELPRRPIPPNTLNLATPGSSRTPTNTAYSSPHVPSFLSKESYVYGRQTSLDDGFPLSPIPVSEFPEPPPAYSEFDRVVNRSTPTVVEQPRREEQPRTQVILAQVPVSPTVPDITTPIGLPNPNRKYLRCHHCGSNVHTMVIRESGVLTHLFAFIFFLLFFPITIVIYFTDAFKNKNHYCPNCNKLIGYEYPFIGQDISYSPT